MALHQISHHFSGNGKRAALPQTVHCGIVGSGDLEVLLEPKALAGGIDISICTPVTGFDHISLKLRFFIFGFLPDVSQCFLSRQQDL